MICQSCCRGAVTPDSLHWGLVIVYFEQLPGMAQGPSTCIVCLRGFLYNYIYVCIYVYVHISHVCVCTYIITCLRVRIYDCICVYMYVYIYISNWGGPFLAHFTVTSFFPCMYLRKC